jgi:nucleoside-diphosphate-sugar epimerase
LAAEHHDDVKPVSLYYDVNIGGAERVIALARRNNINNIIFTSSVAVYGSNEKITDESHPPKPNNHYGKSKLRAEALFKDWYDEQPQTRSLLILRPTVVFGERNHGNVIKLFRQIESGKFFFVGSGKNIKSIAYLDNVVHFMLFMLDKQKPSYNIINYADKPDLNTHQLVTLICNKLQKKIPRLKVPLALGVVVGLFYDILALITKKRFSISLLRIIKFTVNTQFDTIALERTGYNAPFTIAQGVERTIEYERSLNNS